MATAYECRVGFVIPRPGIKTHRGNIRNFGQGGVYVVADEKAVERHVKLGWLVPIAEMVAEVEQATAAPGERRTTRRAKRAPKPQPAPEVEVDEDAG